MMTACKVSWCCAVADVESDACAVHRKYPTLECPSMLTPDDRLDYPQPTISSITGKAEAWIPALACKNCDGTGECPDCDGEGTHMCHAPNCDEEHDCRTCDGQGKCEDCDGSGGIADGVTVQGDGWRRRDVALKLIAVDAYGKDDDGRDRARAYLRAVMLPVWIPPAERMAR